MAASPAQLVERLLQQRVELSLKDERTVTGRLLGCDEHMNLVLDDAQEATPEVTRRLGRIVLRGSNVVTISSPGPAAPAP
jgi:small nuclear ribonucleoprotein